MGVAAWLPGTGAGRKMTERRHASKLVRGKKEHGQFRPNSFCFHRKKRHFQPRVKEMGRTP